MRAPDVSIGKPYFWFMAKHSMTFAISTPRCIHPPINISIVSYSKFIFCIFSMYSISGHIFNTFPDLPPYAGPQVYDTSTFKEYKQYG